MVQIVLIGIAAGLAAALLFLAPASGSFLAFPLFALTALPLAIAGLGWGFIAAAIGAAAGAIVTLAVIPSGLSALVFILLFGAPVVWLTRLAGLSRTAEGEKDRAWYPLGGLLLHAGLAVAIALVLVGFVIGYEPEAVLKEATAGIVEWMAAAQTTGPAPTAAELEPAMRIYVALMPFMVALLMVAIIVFDLWLASIIARMSGRLQRPAERLWTVALPNRMLIGLAVAGVLAFLPAPFGEIAGVVAGALAGTLVIVGLAVLHALTLGMSGRLPALILAYLLLFLSGLPIVLFALLGAGETLLHFRARRFGRPSTPD
jgi:hypothetical protein